MNVMERADRAKELLENSVFKQAFSAVESDIVGKLKSVGFDDHGTQHELVLCLQLLGNVKRKLETWVADGKVEQKKLNDLNWREKAKQVFKG